jgi:hypothetical protein
MPANNQLTHTRSYNPPRAPTWASMVRGEGLCVVENTRPLQQPAVTAADFTALYDRCSASGLKARVVFSHTAGHQTLTLSCTFPAPAEFTAAAGKRHRRHCRRQRRGRAATAAPGDPDQATSPTAAPTDGPMPQQAILVQSPESPPPPLKKLRKRRNEVELLRDCNENNKMSISPPPIRCSTSSPPPSAAFQPSPSSQPTPPSDSPPPKTPDSPTIEPALPLLEPAIPPDLPTTATSPQPPSPAPITGSLPSSTPPSSPPPRAPHQVGWNLCQRCQTHYHDRIYYHCWF